VVVSTQGKGDKAALKMTTDLRIGAREPCGSRSV